MYKRQQTKESNPQFDEYNMQGGVQGYRLTLSCFLNLNFKSKGHSGVNNQSTLVAS